MRCAPMANSSSASPRASCRWRKGISFSDFGLAPNVGCGALDAEVCRAMRLDPLDSGLAGLHRDLARRRAAQSRAFEAPINLDMRFCRLVSESRTQFDR